MGINLNDLCKRYFDVIFTQQTIQSGVGQFTSQQILMQQCTASHFSKSQSIKTTFNQNHRHVNWLCPQINSSFSVQGKFSNKVLKYGSIAVKKCDLLLDLDRPCVSQSQIQSMQNKNGPFTLSLFYSNALINPGIENYIDFYLQNNNYITFSSKLGVYSNIYIEDFQIETDNSILPFTQINAQQGITITQAFKNTHYLVNSDLYANFFLFKSSSSTSYSRSFFKIDELFSYVGGLVGVIFAGMFLLTSYNQFSFQHDLASYLYQKNPLVSQANLWTFIKQSLYSIYKHFFSPDPKKFQKIEKLIFLREQMSKQLDLNRLLNRVLFLERSVRILLDYGQFQVMHLATKLSLENSKKLRQQMNFKHLIQTKNKVSKISNIISINQGESGKNRSTFQLNQQNNIDNKQVKTEEQNSEQSFDSDLEQELKNALRSFKKSYEQGNIRNLQIAQLIDRQLLRAALSSEQNISLQSIMPKELESGVENYPFKMRTIDLMQS